MICNISENDDDDGDGDDGDGDDDDDDLMVVPEILEYHIFTSPLLYFWWV